MDSLLLTLTVLLLVRLHSGLCSPTPTDIHHFVPLPAAGALNLPQLHLPLTPATHGSSEADLDELEGLLTELLIADPWQTMGDPLVYITEPEVEMQPVMEMEGSVPTPWKRSRYYRRYPWKRQNGRNYDPDGYICNPSKDDVFELLLALHEAKGGKDRTVHFCNRRRPARAIFTNIRFLGRRK